ncbi:hypothetical protein ABPG72_004010 [Tetrahymena utriculariae]
MNKFSINLDIIILALACVLFYFIHFNSMEIQDKSPPNQHEQFFIFPNNFTKLQTPLYSKLIFIISDGITYDFVDSRIKEIPFTQEDKCDIHVHQIKIFNELLNSSPKSVIFQRLQIEQPPKTEIKISTFLTGINPTIFSKKIPKRNPYKKEQVDSLLYQVGNSKKVQKNYGFLTYYLYDYIGYWLNLNQFALDPYYYSYEQLKVSDEKKFEEYIKIIKSNQYDTLFIYQGILDEVGHLEGMHTPNVLDAQKYIDRTIREIIDNMDDDAILLMISDHGKDEEGGHFSCKNNPNLCDSIFFAYTKKGFIQDDQFIQSTRRLETIERIVRQGVKYQAHESMISCTLSVLLNIPISFINSGRPLIELYPASKFGNRVEMLQRILQDSFTSLEQQKQLYSKMQEIKNCFDNKLFKNTIQKINDIEDQLYYEFREQHIYTENGLESMINSILEQQNDIQNQIYDYQNQPKALFYFGIIFSACVCLRILILSAKTFLKERKEIIACCLILLLIGLGITFFIINVTNIKSLYGVIVAIALGLYFGVLKLKESKLAFFAFLVQTILICLICFICSQSDLFYISVCSEMMIILIYSYQKFSLNKISILTAIILGACRFYNYDIACLCINSFFYIYYHNTNQQIKNQKLISRPSYKVDLLILNFIYTFIGLVSDNYLFYELGKYYPLVLLNLYLLSDLIGYQQKLFNSFYLHTQILFQAQLLFTILGFQQHYQSDGFNLTIIFIYYLPIPLIPEMSKNSFNTYKKVTEQDKEKENFQPAIIKGQQVALEIQQVDTDSKSSKSNLQLESLIKKQEIQYDNQELQQYNLENQIINEQQQSTLQELQDSSQKNDETEILLSKTAKDLTECKDGIIFYCAIIIIFSCVSELIILFHSLVFPFDDNFIFVNSYQTASIVSILVVNLLLVNSKLIN